MKFQFIILLVVVNSLSLTAQDSIYYNTAFNKADDSLKFELNQIIKGHTEFTYTSSSTDVWDILKETDKDTSNSDNVILIYSGRSVDAAQEYNSGSGWSREHVWAKSRGDFGTSNGAGTDVHHLRPCDISVNSTRNNRNFDTCFTCVDVIDNGFNTGSKRDANLWTFEPPDEVKGDVARMIFYMAVRYEGAVSEPDLELTNTLLSNTDKSPLQARLTTLLHWSRIDGVSDWERNRNDIIYNDYQHNRNPFIDYPELSEYLWGDSVGEVWMPTPVLASSKLDGVSSTKASMNIYPNPFKDEVSIGFRGNTSEVVNLKLLSFTGQVIEEWEIPSAMVEINLSLSNTPTGVYFLKLRQGATVIIKKVIKQ